MALTYGTDAASTGNGARCTTAQLTNVPSPLATQGCKSDDLVVGSVRASGASTVPDGPRLTSNSPRAAASKNDALASSRTTAGSLVVMPPRRVGGGGAPAGGGAQGCR